MCILGDLDCNMLKTDKDNIPTKKIKSLYELYQLTQMIVEATRVTMTTSSLILAIFLLTHQKKISDSGVIHTDISDHSLVFAIRKISVIDKQENILEIRNMKKNFIGDSLKQPWEHIYLPAKDPNAMWEIWKKYF